MIIEITAPNLNPKPQQRLWECCDGARIRVGAGDHVPPYDEEGGAGGGGLLMEWEEPAGGVLGDADGRHFLRCGEGGG